MSTIEYVAFDASRYPTPESCIDWLRSKPEYKKITELKGFRLKKTNRPRLLTNEIRPAFVWQGDLSQSLNLSVDTDPLPYILAMRVDGNRLKQQDQLLTPLPSTLEAEAKKKAEQEEKKKKAAEARKLKKEQAQRDKAAGITKTTKKRKSQEKESDPSQASPPHTNGTKDFTASATSSEKKIDSGKDEELEVDSIGLGNLDDLDESTTLSQPVPKREASSIPQKGPVRKLMRPGAKR